MKMVSILKGFGNNIIRSERQSRAEWIISVLNLILEAVRSARLRCLDRIMFWSEQRSRAERILKFYLLKAETEQTLPPLQPSV